MFREGEIGITIPTVFIFGAGASKGLGVPLAKEILPMILESSDIPKERSEKIKKFLEDFAWPYGQKENELPTFEEVLSFLDLAIARGEVFSESFQKWKLEEIRNSFIYCLELLIESEKNKNKGNVSEYKELVSLFSPQKLPYGTFITLNYDTLLDESFIGVKSRVEDDDYLGADYCMGKHSSSFSLFGDDENLMEGLKLYNFFHSNSPVKLLKLHGSISWGFCPRCKMMVGPYKGTPSVERKGVEGKCLHHKIPLQTLIVPPSWSKNYNVHSILNVWEMARIRLLEAERVVFIGYSLPEADQEIRYLLKTCLFRENEPTPFIYVVDKKDGNDAQKYERFFDEFEYLPVGFDGYVERMVEQKEKTDISILGLTESEHNKFERLLAKGKKQEIVYKKT
jgi:hypothetical protein